MTADDHPADGEPAGSGGGAGDPQGAPVGVVGLGTIGAGVAEALLRAGFPTVVCDVRSDATDRFAGRATVAPDPAAVCRQAPVVLLAVVDDAQVRSVLLGAAPGATAENGGGPAGPEGRGTGALAAARPGTVFVVLSTISADCLAEMGAAAVGAGCDVIDCGVSGGPQAAARGDLVCLVGGAADTVARVEPVLRAFSSVVLHMGGLGTGLAAKLARNLIQYGSWLAAHEGQRLAEAAGVPLSKLAEAVRAADARAGGPTALMFRPTAAPFTEADDAGLVAAMRGAAALARKDLRAALSLAADLGVSLPATAMAETKCDEVFGVPVGEP